MGATALLAAGCLVRRQVVLALRRRRFSQKDPNQTALARLGGRRSAVRLSALAAQERRHAKRLSAAYFLISGVYYHPAGQAAPRLERTFLGSLRARFLAEQREEAAYRAAADCRDPCLRELFLELAGEERGHSQTLRGILEEL